VNFLYQKPSWFILIILTKPNFFQRRQVISISWPEDRKRMEIDSVTFSSAKPLSLNGWKPRFTFEEGLNKTKEIMLGAGQK